MATTTTTSTTTTTEKTTTTEAPTTTTTKAAAVKAEDTTHFMDNPDFHKTLLNDLKEEMLDQLKSRVRNLIQALFLF